MTKNDLAAQFFEQLSEDSSQFITDMIEKEMNAELLELFSNFGAQLSPGEMDPNSFQTSLLIIGYLVRAHEEAKLSEQDGQEQVH